MSFADGSSSVCSACNSVNCSPAAMDTIDPCCARRRSVSATSASVSVIVGRPGPAVAGGHGARHRPSSPSRRWRLRSGAGSGWLGSARLLFRRTRLGHTPATQGWATRRPGSAPAASPGAPRCSPRSTPMGGAGLEDEDPSDWKPRAAAIAAMTMSGPGTRILGLRGVVVGAGSR